MDASELLSRGVAALGGKAWGVDTVLHVGAELAQVVNSLKNLSGNDKSDLVCQTILKLLDDGETAEKERLAVSTETTKTTIPWNDCRKVVKTVLPVTLDLVVKASRGQIRLPAAASSFGAAFAAPFGAAVAARFGAAVADLPRWKNWFQRFVFCRQKNAPASPDSDAAAAAAPAAAASPDSVTVLLPSPSPSPSLAPPAKDPLAEVRELVSRVEKMLKDAQALPEVKAARLQQNLLQPTPEQNAVLLPGELPTPVEAPVSP
jgi:hypothetical protein